MKASDSLGLTQESLVQLQSEFERFWQIFFLSHQARFSRNDFFEPLYYDVVEFASRRAKRIRPILFLASYRIFTREGKIASDLWQMAAALELLHSFILIHDDIIDQSEKRRGLPTFHKLIELKQGNRFQKERIGQNIALVMGDILLVLAIETFSRAVEGSPLKQEALQKFLSYVTETGMGEVHDILLSASELGRINFSDIEQMYHKKTTRYTIECPLLLGALWGGGKEEKLFALETFARPIGMAFQIQNDLLEFQHFDWDDVMFQSDILEGKKTFLLRAAYENLSDTDRAMLQLCLKPGLGKTSVYQIHELIQKSGAVEVLNEKMQQLFEEAENILIHSPLSELEQKELLLVINWIRQQK
ncbi:MAG: polyprenyl synthetase family protein [Verrucomicrobiae bacterium]|nr:polyprenyl synthetase family protein [Verrucomicrobiae bacterium]